MIKIEKVKTYGWEHIFNYENLYLISKKGEVYSIRNKKILKPYCPNGYLQIELNKNGKHKKYLIHRLVAQTYLPNKNDLPCVNHKDGNKLNNDVSNLEWCTYSENMIHASNHKLLKAVGENQHSSKLKKEDVKYIKSVYKKGDLTYGSSALGKKFNVDHKTIFAIVNGKTWRDIA